MTPHRSLFVRDPQTPVWRISIIHSIAKLLGVRVKVKGLPLGSDRLNRRFPEAFDVDSDQLKRCP